MKVLVITSRYPPYHHGGYELRCRDIVNALSEKGHAILVLTSQREKSRRAAQSESAYPVHRRLHFDLKAGNLFDQMTLRRWSYPLGMLLIFTRALWLDWLDTAFVDQQIKRFQPDVIYLGHIINLSKALLPYLSAVNIPIVYDEGGSGLRDLWTEKGIWYKFVCEYPGSNAVARQIKAWIMSLVRTWSKDRIRSHWGWPQRMQVIFNGDLNYRNALEKGVPVDGAKIIHSGVDTTRFTFCPRDKLNSPLLLLVPGRIEPRKGQLDAVRLLAKLGEHGLDARLTLVGENWVGSYYREVEGEIAALHLEDKVLIQPMIDHDRLVELYQRSDICFFASHYRTGFSRVPLEAMACGCIVISYGNEGSNEIIRNGQTGFVFEPEDYAGMACVIMGLVSNPDRVKQIVDAAGQEIEAHFAMTSYVSLIEETLLSTAALQQPVMGDQQ